MQLSYVSDATGNTVAVQIPIEEWNTLKQRFPDVENLQSDTPQWQKDLVEKRLENIAANPGRLRPIEELFEELDDQN